MATFFSDALRRVVLNSPLAPVARRLADAARRDIYRDARRRLLIDEEIVPMLEPGFDPATWVIKQTAFGFRIWCSLDERAISRPIMLDVYEHAESRFIERTVKPGDLAVDVGANIGYHALHLAKLTGPQGCVEAFEPLRALADVLERSRDENGFTARMTVHHLALDEVAGELRLRHAPRTSNFGGAHLSADDVVPPDHVDVTVRTARLDDVVGERTCRFIKIDVEGAEPRVMRGARATLARCKPLILSELHDAQLRIVSGSCATDFIAQMAASGYRCARLNADGTAGESIDRYDEPVPANVIFDPLVPDETKV